MRRLENFSEKRRKPGRLRATVVRLTPGHFSAFFEIYKICKTSHRSEFENLQISSIFVFLLKFSSHNADYLLKITFFQADFDEIWSEFCENFTEIQQILKI